MKVVFMGGVFALPVPDVIIQWPLNPIRLVQIYQGYTSSVGDYLSKQYGRRVVFVGV